MATKAAVAKTTRPSLAGVLRRERLFDAIDDKRKSPLVWIAGPAGAGKTTLASSYLDTRAVQSIWYQLDAGDEDAGTFFHFMTVAARRSLKPEHLAMLPAYGPEHQGAIGDFARRQSSPRQVGQYLAPCRGTQGLKNLFHYFFP